MQLAAMLLLSVLAVALLLPELVVAAEKKVEEKVDTACLIDKKKPADEKGNLYEKCSTDEAKKAGKTRCCTINGNMGCCEAGTKKTGRMLTIALSIVGTALAIGILVYICTWCDRDTYPCIGRCEDRMHRGQEKMEEHIYCCRGRVEQRRQEQLAVQNDKYADFEEDQTANVKLPAPAEFKAEVKDEWY